ncbi:helix-turn-helix domain-containing protein [Actinoplanes sp. NPDC049265]|uniref:AraC-like ligand-binding domain-containing protein n=1 Tax=Actinoplanes sp. NPDC049265 TaxID=3363902 RepID=UPI00371E4173
MYHAIDLRELPAGDRFDFWHQSLSTMYAPIDVRTAHPRSFSGGVEALEMGGAQVATVRCSAVTASRTTRLIRRSDPECYHLNLGVHGRFGLNQGGRTVTFGPGDLVLYQSWRPFRTTSESRQRTVSVIEAHIPRRLVPLSTAQAESVAAVRLPVHSGLGALLTQFLGTVAQDCGRYGPDDEARLTGILAELVGGVLAAHLGADARPAGRVGLLQVRQYIESRLGDPALGPAGVAAAHHLSVRSLHRLFHGSDDSVAEYIRRRRLENCRHDLADPGQRHVPIRALAARWGFADPANFNRAFRTRYGLTPGDFRASVPPAPES